MIGIIVLHCASEGVYGIDVVHQRILLGRERFSLLKCGRSAAAAQRTLNAWQRRVLSWQRSVLGSEATSPCMSPSSSPSKLLRARNRAGSRTVHGADASSCYVDVEGAWSFCRWPSCGDVQVVCHPGPRRLR